MKQSFLRVFGLLSILAVFPVLVAFVHPPEYAFKKWQNRVKTIRSLHIQQTRYLNLSGRADRVALEEEVWMLRPGLYRRTVKGLQRQIHWIVGRQRAGRVENGRFEVKKLVDVVEPHEMPFYAGDSGRLATLLRQSGIEVDQSHWVLEGDTEALAVGQLGENRFIFEKETYFPLSAHLGQNFFFFPVPRPSKFRTPFPAKIEVFRGEDLKETIEVRSVKINAPVSKNLFEVSSLLRVDKEAKKAYPKQR